jgi:chromosome segregation ATPase
MNAVMLVTLFVPLVAAGTLILSWLFGPGKREFEEACNEREEARKQVAKLTEKVEELTRRNDKLGLEIKQLQDERTQLRNQVRQSRDDLKKVTRLESQLAQSQTEAQRLREGQEAVVRDLKSEFTVVCEKSRALDERVKTLSLELERAKAAPPPPPPPPPPPVVTEKVVVQPRVERVVDTSREDALKEEVAGLRKALRNMEHDLDEATKRNRTLRRMEEHNRRAYLMTYLQLELAQDELYFLQSGGKKRRDTERSRRHMPDGPASLAGTPNPDPTSPRLRRASPDEGASNEGASEGGASNEGASNEGASE